MDKKVRNKVFAVIAKSVFLLFVIVTALVLFGAIMHILIMHPLSLAAVLAVTIFGAVECACTYIAYELFYELCDDVVV